MIDKVLRSNEFLKETKHLDSFILKKLKKQILKILENPKTGKPLKYFHGERTIYIKPYRLIYAVRDNELVLLKFKHRKNVYD